MGSILEARDLTVQFGSSLIAVDEVNITVNPGQVLTLCGPNGAGKSTLLSALAGDLKPTRGCAFLDKKPVGKYATEELSKRRAVLEQSPSLTAAFSVGQLAGLSIGIEVPPLEAGTLIRDLLTDVGLVSRINDRVDLLSGGQRHRAHLARVLGQLASAGEREGRYLLLDEPTASLDLVHQIAVMKVARRAALRGVGVLVILHDLNLAAAFSDRVALMAKGRVVDEGPPADVFTSKQLSDIYEASIEVMSDAQNTLRIFPVFSADPV